VVEVVGLEASVLNQVGGARLRRKLGF